MIEEMKADFKYHQSGNAVEDDVFYPFKKYRLGWFKRKIPSIIDVHESLASEEFVFGEKIDQHFEARVEFSWHKYLK